MANPKMNKFEIKSQQTKKDLIDAFWDLMIERDFDKIRIKQITDKAGVYRSTFYLHFLDLYDLLEQEENRLVAKWQKVSEEMEKTIDSLDLLIAIAKFYEENALQVFLLIREKRSSMYEIKMKNLIKERLKELYDVEENQEVIYIFEFYISAILQTLSYWYQNDSDKDIFEVVTLMFKLMENGISGMWDRR
ncbi:putative transcriptional regulator [Streptococcus gallolyticus]|uniref:Transcriptional regulator n=1 Tax=Streptococcus gallolyticus TaxID=315405 RepID=A0AA94M136_9STRE|nr:TetR/AcrR family transcriptional regulator [Streptococcus gallolyticus]AQP41311.1 transcriptional regulator [Streptococcus gallolyticus subsp. gallolyticus DSM 16831]SQG78593.1 putative transcriptional regulator [Streptococcus gallolyticus]